MLDSFIKCLRGRIAEARHDIEAIEIHIASKDGASSSPKHIEGLRGLQEMYRKRIAQIDAEILASLLAKDGNSEGDEVIVAFSLESLDHPTNEGPGDTGLKPDGMGEFRVSGFSLLRK